MKEAKRGVFHSIENSYTTLALKIFTQKNGRVLITLPFFNLKFETKISNLKSYSTPWGNNSRRS